MEMIWKITATKYATVSPVVIYYAFLLKTSMVSSILPSLYTHTFLYNFIMYSKHGAITHTSGSLLMLLSGIFPGPN